MKILLYTIVVLQACYVDAHLENTNLYKRAGKGEGKVRARVEARVEDRAVLRVGMEVGKVVEWVAIP
jgi:hypothetical protein